MALRINTNILSVNAQRNLDFTNRMFAKTLERLSSGLRINRAADDAAGMAISEKLRAQVRGFGMAIANAQDSINLIQTAEGAIQQSTDILQRMRELSLQASNDTLTTSDREKIQAEMSQLRDELTNIATKTEFNGRVLLDGTVQSTAQRQNSTGKVNQNIRVGDTAATISNIADFVKSQSLTVSTMVSVDVAFQLRIVAADATTSYLEIRSSRDGVIAGSTGIYTLTGGQGVYGDNEITLYSGAQIAANVVATFVIEAAAGDVSIGDIGKTGLIQITAFREAVTVDNSLTFQVGPNEGQFLKMGVSDIRASALRLESINVVGTTDEDSRAKSQSAIGVIDSALDFVNSLRAKLGGFQNRIESTIASMSVTQENLSAAESRIRDADIAAETSNLTRAQILIQAGTAVLTQANLNPQTALTLLR